MVTLASPNTAELPAFEVRGGAYDVITNETATEQLLEGPRGTGKTMALCWWANVLAQKYPHSRLLICRKVARTLSTTVLATLTEKVITPYEPVSWFGGSEREPASFRYGNGSRIVVGGLDSADKILSSEYDHIYVNEATELSLEDWEGLTALLRNHVMPHQRLVGDCNPSHDKHWLLQRCHEGKTRHVKSRIQDNPAYYDQQGNVTAEGADYIAKLKALTGTRYERFWLGRWVGVENAIYETFDRDVHMGYPHPGTVWEDGCLGVDYGDVHPHAVVAVQRAKGGRLWVRETWLGQSWDVLVEQVGRMRREYGIRRILVDPMLKGWDKTARSPLGFPVELSDGAPGARKVKVESVRGLMDLMGRNGPALMLVKGAPGNDILAAQIEAYHWQHRQTETMDDLQVARIDDDAVAAMEDAVEGMVRAGVDLAAVRAMRGMVIR